MATQVPASLRAADISRFAQRATQLESVKPVVAYWCNYWIAQQILSKGLHNADQDALIYTTNIMDKLEQYKGENMSIDAVVDDTAGKAYIEQFGLETFDRAEKAVHANRASRNTADTYQAASTFLDLLEIWGKIEPEIAKKIKYAKFHALRIVRALKAGEDPNLSKPRPEPSPEQLAPELDPNDPEVQMLGGAIQKPRQPSVVDVPDSADREQRNLAAQSLNDESLHPSRDTSAAPKARQPSVVDVPDQSDAEQANQARLSFKDESLHPSRVPSGTVSPLPPDAANFYGGQNVDISPMSANERKSSAGGNYFPQMPPPAADQSLPDIPPTLPSAPDMLSDSTSPMGLPGVPSDNTTANDRSLPQPPNNFSPKNSISPDTILPPAPPGQSNVNNIPPNFAPSTQPPPFRPEAPPQLRQNLLDPTIAPFPHPQPLTSRAPVAQRSAPVIQQPTAPMPSTVVEANIEVDEAAMIKAEKHARWAISALNFEDVPTAIQNLRLALQTLGAR